MGRLLLAFKTFFQILGSGDLAEQVQRLNEAPRETPATTKPTPVPAPPPPPQPKRSDALTLLETLQREARLLDFVMEEIDSYSDAQVGGAVREVHRGCREVISRLFAVHSVVDLAEGSQFEVTSETDSARVRLAGNVSESRPLSGELVHAGWQVERCEFASLDRNKGK